MEGEDGEAADELQFSTHTRLRMGLAPSHGQLPGTLGTKGTSSVSASILPYSGLPEKVHFVKAFSSSQHSNLWPSQAAGGGLS